MKRLACQRYPHAPSPNGQSKRFIAPQQPANFARPRRKQRDHKTPASIPSSLLSQAWAYQHRILQFGASSGAWTRTKRFNRAGSPLAFQSRQGRSTCSADRCSILFLPRRPWRLVRFQWSPTHCGCSFFARPYGPFPEKPNPVNPILVAQTFPGSPGSSRR